MNATVQHPTLGAALRTYIGLLRWFPPLGLILLLLIAALPVGWAGGLEAAVAHLLAWSLAPSDMPAVWRYVVTVAFIGGAGAGYRALDVAEVGFAGTLPMLRQRRVMGAALVALAYAALLGSVAAATHSVSAVVAVTGVTVFLFAITATAADEYAYDYSWKSLLGVLLVCVFPAPIVWAAERFGVVLGLSGWVVAFVLFRQVYAPSSAQKAGRVVETGQARRHWLRNPFAPSTTAAAVVAVEEVADLRDVEIRPVPRDEDALAIVEYQPTLVGYVQACLAQRGKTLIGMIKVDLVLSVLVAVSLYFIKGASGFVIAGIWGLTPWTVSARRVLPVSRRERARNAYAVPLLHGGLRVAVWVSMLLLLVWWNPFPRAGAQTIAGNLKGMALLGLLVPLLAVKAAWIPRADTEDDEEKTRPRVRTRGRTLVEWVAAIVLAAGVLVLTIATVAFIYQEVTTWSPAGQTAFAIALFLLVHAACWEVIQWRYRRGDLLT